MKKAIKYIFFLTAVCLGLLFGKEGKAATENSFTHIEKIEERKVSDAEFERMAKRGAAVSGRSGFIKEFQKHAVKREKAFTIVYKGDVNSISSLDTLVEELGEIDSKKTSDDADFLSGGILDLGWSSYYNSSNQLVMKCKMNYTETAAQVKKLNTKAKKVLKNLKVSSMSDVAKVKVIHDYVVKLVTYDYSLKDHSAYGGLAAEKHSTVCQGYALIMYKLLTDAGVPVHYVTGDAGGPHAWNIVKIKGKWYELDATWDDPSNTTSYDYFLVGSKQISKDHTLDSYYKKKYKISAGNLNWKKLIKNSKKKDDKKVKTDQTAKEKEKTEAATLRQETIRLLSDAIDAALKEGTDISDYEVQMYDLCKKVFGHIIEEMSDKTFQAFIDSEEMLDAYINGTFELMEEYILNPMSEYMDSDDFMNAIYEAMYEDFDREDFEEVSEKELEGLIEAYAYQVFTEKLYMQSEAYVDSIVSGMVEYLDEMA